MFHFKKSRNKYDGLIACPYCGNTEMNTGLKIGGHLKACPVRYLSISNTIEVLSTTETDKLEDVDFNDFDEDDVNYNLCVDTSSVMNELVPFDDLDSEFEWDINFNQPDHEVIQDFICESERYLRRQLQISDLTVYEGLEAGWVLTLANIRKPANIRNYFEIAEFLSKCHGMSLHDSDEMLNLIRRVSAIGKNYDYSCNMHKFSCNTHQIRCIFYQILMFFTSLLCI
jgi:hypothetical protein